MFDNGLATTLGPLVVFNPVDGIQLYVRVVLVVLLGLAKILTEEPWQKLVGPANTAEGLVCTDIVAVALQAPSVNVTE